MSRIFNWILCLFFITFQTCFSLHHIGSTSMDSTHYDRRIVHDQCVINHQPKELSRERFWLIIRSIATSNSSASNTQQSIVPIRKQLITNNGEDRLVIRTSPNILTENRTVNLGIDQTMVDIIVDKQVKRFPRKFK